MDNERYQGWTNMQTWCVALTFDNTKKLQDKMLSTLRITNEFNGRTPQEIREKNVHRLILDHAADVVAMAPWVWEENRYPERVNLTEIIEHFLDKVNELHSAQV